MTVWVRGAARPAGFGKEHIVFSEVGDMLIVVNLVVDERCARLERGIPRMCLERRCGTFLGFDMFENQRGVNNSSVAMGAPATWGVCQHHILSV